MFISRSANHANHSNSRQRQVLPRNGSAHSLPKRAIANDLERESIERHTILNSLRQRDVFEAVFRRPEQTDEAADVHELRQALQKNPLTVAEVFGDETHPPDPELIDNFQSWNRRDTSSIGSSWLHDDDNVSSDTDSSGGVIPSMIKDIMSCSIS